MKWPMVVAALVAALGLAACEGRLIGPDLSRVGADPTHPAVAVPAPEPSEL